MSKEEEHNEVYSLKEVVEMIHEAKEEMGKLTVELKETTTRIRDYNGLREIINECRSWQIAHDAERRGKEIQAEAAEVKTKFGWEKMGYIVGVLSLLVAFAALSVK